MPGKPILLFLHGVGDGDLDDEWMKPLSKALADAGYPGLDEATVIAPKYAKALKYPVDDKEDLPPITIKAPGGEVGARNRRAFERRLGALEVMLGRHDRGTGWAGGPALVDLGLAPGLFEQARRYLGKSQTRARVLNRVLIRVPRSGRVTIVGHSLGSVIASDVIRRLPADIEVSGMITIGSPVAHTRFDVDGLKSTLLAPPTNLSWWVNYWNQADPVTASRGLSSVFPWMLDLRVQTESWNKAHDATSYLADSSVAAAIGYGLFGSPSKSLAVIDKGIDIAPDYAETVALLALRFAHLTKEQIDGDRRVRFELALREVQAATVELIENRNRDIGRPLPSAVSRLAVDRADPDGRVDEPLAIRNLSKDEAVVPLISIVSANVVRPFEISVPNEKSRLAMEQLTLDMGLGSQIGSDVLKAMEQARETLRKDGDEWRKRVMIGAGLVALIGATGGLALAAAPGVVGAAAVTSALAAFGPGGMIGGLLTAGALTSAGSGSIAAGLASSNTAAATVEAVVSAQLAAAIVRQLQGLEQDPGTWEGLAESEIAVCRERARLAAISDESAPTLKELNRKLEAVERALRYLQKHGLGPDHEMPLGLDPK